MTTDKELLQQMASALRGCAGDTDNDEDTRLAVLEKYESHQQRERENAQQRVAELETRLRAMTEWLEKNQHDVFKKGLWDAISAAVPRPETREQSAQQEPVAWRLSWTEKVGLQCRECFNTRGFAEAAREARKVRGCHSFLTEPLYAAPVTRIAPALYGGLSPNTIGDVQ